MLMVAGVVCSQSPPELGGAAAQRRGGLFKDAQPPYRCREALLINRYCSSLNRPPQPSLREGIPALLRRGMSRASWTAVSARRGGRDINKISRSLLYGAEGVVFKFC